ncbi:MAG: hypothetical protein JNL97_06580, partial [Verrucomicrobiales bacterium]|nr:hypothetical protein [Verrucomicrobiales bacterium]
MVTALETPWNALEGKLEGWEWNRPFPEDLATWTEPERLLTVVAAAAHRSGGGLWMDLLRGFPAATEPDDLLILVAYCYLRGIYPSQDVLRQLDSDDVLASMRPRFALRPEQVRQFRRRNRSALADCLTHALLQLRTQCTPEAPAVPFGDSLVWNRHNLGYLQPFYLQARDRLDRAVALDSMALD